MPVPGQSPPRYAQEVEAYQQQFVPERGAMVPDTPITAPGARPHRPMPATDPGVYTPQTEDDHEDYLTDRAGQAPGGEQAEDEGTDEGGEDTALAASESGKGKGWMVALGLILLVGGGAYAVSRSKKGGKGRRSSSSRASGSASFGGGGSSYSPKLTNRGRRRRRRGRGRAA